MTWAILFFWINSVWGSGELPISERHFSQLPDPRTPEIAILGDSSSTGTLADPKVEATRSTMFQRIPIYLGSSNWRPQPNLEIYSSADEFHLKEPLQTPLRIYVSQAELKMSNEVQKKSIDQQSRSARVLEQLEYSWGYLIGRRLNVPGSKILFVGNSRARINYLWNQILRLKEASPTHLPRRIFVNYTANDFCDPELFQKPSKDFFNSIEEKLRENLLALQKHMKPHPFGTTIYLVSPLPVLNALRNPEILQKEISMVGGDLTCSEFRQLQQPRYFLRYDIAQEIRASCPVLYKTQPHESAKINHLHHLVEGMGQSEYEVVRQLQINPQPGFQFVYVPGLTTLSMTAKDVANDCLHPSIYAHEKFARHIWKYLQIPSAPLLFDVASGR